MSTAGVLPHGLTRGHRGPVLGLNKLVSIAAIKLIQCALLCLLQRAGSCNQAHELSDLSPTAIKPTQESRWANTRPSLFFLPFREWSPEEKATREVLQTHVGPWGCGIHSPSGASQAWRIIPPSALTQTWGCLHSHWYSRTENRPGKEKWGQKGC